MKKKRKKAPQHSGWEAKLKILQLIVSILTAILVVIEKVIDILGE